MSTEDSRQRIVRVPGSRRVKLTPAPGTTTEPVMDDEEPDAAASGSPTFSGPNDAQLRLDVPPHY
ncbi:hypothetical protein QL996_05335 [Planococcus sp. APC 4015]|nr:hypothetical protein [Planococcus sp. APC 4015]